MSKQNNFQNIIPGHSNFTLTKKKKKKNNNNSNNNNNNNNNRRRRRAKARTRRITRETDDKMIGEDLWDPLTYVLFKCD